MPSRASTDDQVPLQRCWKMAHDSKTKARIGVVVNFYDHRRTADADFMEWLASASMPVFGTLPTATAITHARGAGTSVAEQDKRSKAVRAFEELTDRTIKEASSDQEPR